ncbi:MAG: aldo/keto reductase [bacterium]|nr:aldo/keto reductase [bacterium]
MIDKEVFRLGLALNYGIDASGAEKALAEYGMNYIFWTPRMKKTAEVVKRALARDRDNYVLATGPTTTFWASQLRRFVEKTLRSLNTDYIDVLQMFWVGVTSSLKPSTIKAMVKLKEEGKVKAIGISIHNRKKAGQLAADSPLDLFMIRYNAAHTGAETDVYPHLDHQRHTLVAYTATGRGKLLKPLKGWEGEPLTAGDCYRFCLTNTNVNVVLTGPKNLQQLEENIAAVKKGPFNQEEMVRIRNFGKAVHG